MKGRSICEEDDVFMKGKMYLWREDVFVNGEDVFMKGKMYLWREKKISGIFEGIKNKILFENQTNSWKFSSQK